MIYDWNSWRSLFLHRIKEKERCHNLEIKVIIQIVVKLIKEEKGI